MSRHPFSAIETNGEIGTNGHEFCCYGYMIHYDGSNLLLS